MKKKTNRKYIVIYECEEDKVAKIQENVIECEVKGFDINNHLKKLY